MFQKNKLFLCSEKVAYHLYPICVRERNLCDVIGRLFSVVPNSVKDVLRFHIVVQVGRRSTRIAVNTDGLAVCHPRFIRTVGFDGFLNWK